jgi:hypothetical protein
MKATTDYAGGIWRRLAWFFGLWLAGVTAVGIVGGVIRWWLFHH